MKKVLRYLIKKWTLSVFNLTRCVRYGTTQFILGRIHTLLDGCGKLYFYGSLVEALNIFGNVGSPYAKIGRRSMSQAPRWRVAKREKEATRWPMSETQQDPTCEASRPLNRNTAAQDLCLRLLDASSSLNRPGNFIFDQTASTNPKSELIAGLDIVSDQNPGHSTRLAPEYHDKIGNALRNSERLHTEIVNEQLDMSLRY